MDHVLDKQRVKVRHSKEKSDAEERFSDEFAVILSDQVFDEYKMKETQRSAYTDEKENILTTRTELKLMENTVENKIELTRIQVCLAFYNTLSRPNSASSSVRLYVVKKRDVLSE
jgi:hypothetical protein